MLETKKPTNFYTTPTEAPLMNWKRCLVMTALAGLSILGLTYYFNTQTANPSVSAQQSGPTAPNTINGEKIMWPTLGQK